MPERIAELTGGQENVRIEAFKNTRNAIYFRETDLVTGVSRPIKGSDLVNSFKSGLTPQEIENGPPAEFAPAAYAREATPLTRLDHPEVRAVLEARDQAHQQELAARDAEHQQAIDQLTQQVTGLEAQVQTAVAAAQAAEAAAQAAQADAQTAEAARVQMEQQLNQATQRIAELENQLQNPPQQNRRRWWNPRTWFRRREQEPVEPELENDALEQYFPQDIAAYAEAREALIEQTDRRKSRILDNILPWRRQERQGYTDALNNFGERLTEILEHRRTAAEADNVAPEVIEEAQRAFIFNQRQVLAQLGAEHSREQVQELIDNGGWRGRWARLMRGLAERPTWQKWGMGAGAAALAALISSTAGVGLFAIAVGAGAKFTLAYLNNRASVRNITDTKLAAELNRVQQARQQAQAAPQTELVGLLQTGERRAVNRARIVNTLGKVAMFAGGGAVTYGIVAGIHGDLPKVPSIIDAFRDGNQSEPVTPKTEHPGRFPDVGPGKASAEELANTHVEFLPLGNGLDSDTTAVRVQDGYHIEYGGVDAEGDRILNLVDEKHDVPVADLQFTRTGALSNESILEAQDSGLYHGPNQYMPIHPHPNDPSEIARRTISTLLVKDNDES